MVYLLQQSKLTKTDPNKNGSTIVCVKWLNI